MAGESSSLVMEGGSVGNDIGTDCFGEDGFGGADDFAFDMDMLLGIINEGNEEDDSDPAKVVPLYLLEFGRNVCLARKKNMCFAKCFVGVL